MYKIHVPTGKAHQGFATIFNPNPGMPRSPDTRLSPSDAFYGMWVDASCVLSKYPDFSVKPKVTSCGEGFYMKSKVKPMIALEQDRSGRPMDMWDAMKKFDRMFHDLHWIGLTPDRVIRFVPKVVTFDIHQIANRFIGKMDILALRAVMMNEEDIMQEMGRIKDDVFRDEDEIE